MMRWELWTHLETHEMELRHLHSHFTSPNSLVQSISLVSVPGLANQNHSFVDSHHREVEPQRTRQTLPSSNRKDVYAIETWKQQKKRRSDKSVKLPAVERSHSPQIHYLSEYNLLSANDSWTYFAYKTRRTDSGLPC